MTRKEFIEQLVKEKKTYQEIGKILNPQKPLSRQRVHQIYKNYQSPAWKKLYGKHKVKEI